jgi:hypothetical protein
VRPDRWSRATSDWFVRLGAEQRLKGVDVLLLARGLVGVSWPPDARYVEPANIRWLAVEGPTRLAAHAARPARRAMLTGPVLLWLACSAG